MGTNQIRERGSSGFERREYDRRDDAVRVAERHTAATSHSARSVAAAVGTSAAACMRSGTNVAVAIIPAIAREREARLIDRVEERLLVLLEIFVVREGKALQRGEHAGEVADEPTGLPSCQLGDVGILLLREHRAARRVGVGETRRNRTPRSSRSTHSSPRRDRCTPKRAQVEHRLGHEVAVARDVEAVLEHRRETEFGRGARPGRAATTSPPARPAPSGDTSSRAMVANRRSTSRASDQPWASR